MAIFLADVRRDEQAARVAQCDNLYERLEETYGRIERGLDAGEDITTWEDLWLKILDEYETVCDRIEAHRG